jgi:hypothetical protein
MSGTVLVWECKDEASSELQQCGSMERLTLWCTLVQLLLVVVYHLWSGLVELAASLLRVI